MNRYERSCTCHPEDNPPVPCQHKYALWECRRARLREMIAEKDKARGRPLTPTEQLNNLEDALGMERGALRR